MPADDEIEALAIAKEKIENDEVLHIVRDRIIREKSQLKNWLAFLHYDRINQKYHTCINGDHAETPC